MAKLTVSIPDALFEQMNEAADGRRYRNKSHLAQVAIEKELEACVKIYPDGDMICALIGKNLQEGQAGFGDDVPHALRALADSMDSRA